MWTIVVAFVVGLVFTLWLASRRSAYRPMFTVSKKPALQLGWQWWGLLACVLVGGGLIVYGVLGLTPGPSPDQLRAEATLAPQGPARLIIPAIKVDEKIVAIPITQKGWDISRLAFHIGWLESTGVKPNDVRAMALIGHVTVSAAQVGPFANLQNLRALDEVIYRAGGSDYVYTVNQISQVKPEDVDRLYVNKGDHLLLVTCTDWNYLTEIYEGRLIAEAVLAKTVPSP